MTYIRRDGSEIAAPVLCDSCLLKDADRVREQEHQRELAEKSTLRRNEWRAALKIEIGAEFEHKTFESFNPKLQHRAYKAIHAWNGNSIILLSPGVYGVGKTHLVCALARRMTETFDAAVSVQGYVTSLPRPVMFTTEQLLLERIRATFHEEPLEYTEQVYQELENIRLLIVDDVAKQSKPRDGSFVESVWYRIIDSRYRYRRPLILTGNLTPDELEQHVGGAAADRLADMCGRNGIIVMSGESQRGRTA